METEEYPMDVFEADNRVLQAEETELIRLADEARRTVTTPLKNIFYIFTFCALAAQNIHSTTLHGVLAVLLVLGLLLRVPFVSALQTTQKLKAQFEELNQCRRELLMKSKSYSKECTDGCLLDHLEVLATELTDSIKLTSGLGRVYLYGVFAFMFQAVLWVGVFVVLTLFV